MEWWFKTETQNKLIFFACSSLLEMEIGIVCARLFELVLVCGSAVFDYFSAAGECLALEV
jgi:hypothetical protein